MKAFISYSHRDEAMLDRFHTHLAMLRREGGIDEWHDRNILVGGAIDREIDRELASCEIFIALVSPDFLNSGYCYEKEMTKAIERQKAGSVAIVPVILEHCDWKSSPLSQFKAAPRDGKPVSEWTNKDAAWLDVISELRKLVNRETFRNRDMPDAAAVVKGIENPATASKYRVKKTFDQIDREDYRAEAFEVIRAFFEKSCEEIDSVEGLRGRYKSLGPNAFTCTVINRMIKSGREGTAHITVRQGSGRFFGDISWSFAANASDNSSNGGFSIEADDYNQYLSGTLMSGGEDKRQWLPNEVANYLWQEFIGHAGISL